MRREISLKEEGFSPQLAKKALQEYLGRRKKMPLPTEIPERFRGKAGFFVSLHKRGKLRGCIGTYLPSQSSIAEEIVENAISAATRDPRFPPVKEEELEDIEISVDILSKPEPVKNKRELNPKKYGVIVNKGWQKGLLLPDLEGVDTVEHQLEIAKQKAGLFDIPDEDLDIYRFTVTRYKEK